MAPYELPSSVTDQLDPASKWLVANRRGSTVWKIKTDYGPYAVKLGYPIEATDQWDGQPWTAKAPAREAAIMRQLTPERIFHGHWAEGTWNAQPWRPGPSLWELWEPHRSADELPQPTLDEAHSCAVTLTALHSKGWAHGDVQPAHFIIGPAGTFLIDLALAHGGGQVPEACDFPYRGCLVHYEAPEISRSVLETGTVTPTPEADVYGLGASLFISATGLRHVDYPDDASRKEQRTAIVERPHRPVTVPGTLGKLIDAMLSRKPEDRPTAAEVCQVLQAA
ncbi:protein kinase domain-containing protein [Streptomyces sp. NPDC054933]